LRLGGFFYVLKKYFNQFGAEIGAADLTQNGQRLNPAFMRLIRSIRLA